MKQRRWTDFLPFIVPAAAGAVMFFVAAHTGAPDRSRPANAAGVDWLSADGGVVVQVRAGAHVTLQLSPAGATHALVLSVDRDRQITPLWPETGADSRLPPGQHVVLPLKLTVPQSPIAAHVFFSNAPLERGAVAAALQQAVVDYGGWPPDAPAPKVPDATAATALLHIAP